MEFLINLFGKADADVIFTLIGTLLGAFLAGSIALLTTWVSGRNARELFKMQIVSASEKEQEALKREKLEQLHTSFGKWKREEVANFITFGNVIYGKLEIREFLEISNDHHENSILDTDQMYSLIAVYAGDLRPKFKDAFDANESLGAFLISAQEYYLRGSAGAIPTTEALVLLGKEFQDKSDLALDELERKLHRFVM